MASAGVDMQMRAIGGQLGQASSVAAAGRSTVAASPNRGAGAAADKYDVVHSAQGRHLAINVEGSTGLAGQAYNMPSVNQMNAAFDLAYGQSDNLSAHAKR